MLHVIKLVSNDKSSLKEGNLVKAWEKLTRFEKEHFQIHFNLSGLVAHYILFSTFQWSKDDQKRLKNLKKINFIEETSAKLLQNMSEEVVRASPQNLILLMKKLVRITGPAAVLFLSGFDNMSKCELSPEETSWIRNKSHLFYYSREAVPPTEEYLSAYFSLFKMNDQSAKGAVIASGSQLGGQRCVYMMKALAEELGEDQLVNVGIRNLPHAVLLTMLKSLEFPSGVAQLRFVTGDNIDLSFYGIEEWRPSTKEELHEVYPLGKKHEFEMQQHLGRKLQDFIRSGDVFILAIFYTLTKCDDYRPPSINQFIRKMLLKKLKEMSQLEPESLLEDIMIDMQEYVKLTQQILSL